MEPASAEELAAELKRADDDRLAVLPRGGGTKAAWGNPPRRAGLVVSTARLSRIVEHPWADLTVTVEAGCRIGVLQEALGAHGQRVAIDPLWPDRATVGGVLSTNDTAALRWRFGGLRDLVIGTTMALADGTLAKSGGKVVKNVAGYDLSKLVAGAFGTLGVITSATFRVHPLPQVASTLTATAESVSQAQQVMLAFQDSQLVPSSLQLRVGSAEPPRIDVLFEGTAAGVDAQRVEARRLAGDRRFDAGAADVWQARQALWHGEGAAILKVATLIAETDGTLAAIGRLAAEARLGWQAVVQATGIGWVRCAGEPDGWPAFVSGLRAALRPHGGSVVILQPLAGAGAVDAWGEAGDSGTLMQAVKREFDPNGTLNPGRFVGGI